MSRGERGIFCPALLSDKNARGDRHPHGRSLSPSIRKQFGGGFLQLFEKTADVAAVVDGVGKLSAYRQHRPVSCRVDLPQQDEWREVRSPPKLKAEKASPGMAEIPQTFGGRVSSQSRRPQVSARA